MSTYKSQILLTKPTKVYNGNGIAFNILPSADSDITTRSFTIRGLGEDEKVSSITCEQGCKLDNLISDNKFSLTFQCALQHWIIFQVHHGVDMVVKCPENLDSKTEVYKCHLAIPNYEDIKFYAEFQYLYDGVTVGVWLINRWPIKINGLNGNYFFQLHKDKGYENVIHLEFDSAALQKQAYQELQIEAILNGNNVAENNSSADDFVASTSSTTSNDDSLPSITPTDELPSLVTPNPIHLNGDYTDVHFKTDDGVIMGSFRCILSALSPLLDRIFKQNVHLPLPIRFFVHGYPSEAIIHGLHYLHGKIDHITEHEMDIFNFANEFGIAKLRDECLPLIEKKNGPQKMCTFYGSVKKVNTLQQIYGRRS